MTPFFAFKEAGEIQMNEDALVMYGVVVNASEIFGLYGYREIFEFKKFWAECSGRSLKLGEIHTA